MGRRKIAPKARGPEAARQRHVRRVLVRLKRCYGDRPQPPGGKAVDALVGTILSQNTSAANSSAGFRQLRRRFRSWSAAAEAPVGRIEECIRISGLSRIKAPRIRTILRKVRADRGKVCLEFLRDLSAQEARDYLMAFDGVGPKTAACVLLFALEMPVFPVDTHIVRIARRLGWTAAGVSAEKAEQALTPLIPPPDRYAMHVLLIAHGRQICRARNPKCGQCALSDLCPEFPVPAISAVSSRR